MGCFALAHFLHSSHLETLQFTLKQVDWARCSEALPSNLNDAAILWTTATQNQKVQLRLFLGQEEHYI